MIKLTLTKEQHAAAILAYAETTLGLKIEMTEEVDYKWWAHEDGSIEAEFTPRKAYEKSDELAAYERECHSAINSWWVRSVKVRNGVARIGPAATVTEHDSAYITFINGLEHKEGDEIPTTFSGAPETAARASWPGVFERFKDWVIANSGENEDQLTWRILPTFKVTPEGCYWRWRCVTEDSMAPIARAFEDPRNRMLNGEGNAY